MLDIFGHHIYNETYANSEVVNGYPKMFSHTVGMASVDGRRVLLVISINVSYKNAKHFLSIQLLSCAA